MDHSQLIWLVVLLPRKALVLNPRKLLGEVPSMFEIKNHFLIPFALKKKLTVNRQHRAVSTTSHLQYRKCCG